MVELSSEKLQDLKVVGSRTPRKVYLNGNDYSDSLQLRVFFL